MWIFLKNSVSGRILKLKTVKKSQRGKLPTILTIQKYKTSKPQKKISQVGKSLNKSKTLIYTESEQIDEKDKSSKIIIKK